MKNLRLPGQARWSGRLTSTALAIGLSAALGGVASAAPSGTAESAAAAQTGADTDAVTAASGEALTEGADQAVVGGADQAVSEAMGQVMAGGEEQAAGTRKVKWVYLTFDDGPSPRYTAQVLKILQTYKVRATFFVIGQNVKRYPALTRRADQRGHSVQSHTWSHPNLRKVNWSTFKYQIRTTDRYVRAQTGYTPRCLRPPYGATNRLVARRAATLGKTIKLWSVDPRDWTRPGKSVIARRVLANVRSGSVVLLHDGGGNRSQTVAALPTILKTLNARGYVFYPLWCR
ncbi:peptidoglycan/xylan/chitin deacetylase (PgdA/CDA1 family) [Kribbella steppae]|uniref:Peptidoglycan/xylan/chitin deacetylase (PgdA/CDA1 family) n=1 Tax=Kribbella steppae TaxID=2512223 RepID=A0A4R2HS13_9ACTN|nr:polysaccharide deacetylase family protein [Kribbella steppae]TCO34012.1 peptidoglycan/xylan/chitin deacetylase (PgdA/CDA1 family) [Kribbella steppae]